LSQVKGATGHGTSARHDRRALEAGWSELPDFVRRHPAALTVRSFGPQPDIGEVTPVRLPLEGQPSDLVSAGLVLLASFSVLEGYRLLDLISASLWHPSAPVFAAMTIPVALLLTRPSDGRRRRRSQQLVLVAAAGLLTVTLVDVVVHTTWSTRLLGGYDLVLAAVAIAAALAGRDLLSDPHRLDSASKE
jgi:hypothetical protein